MRNRSTELGHAAPDVLHEVSVQFSQVIGFVPRAQLAQALDERSHGRLQLNPPT